jgi:hypothetical protein
VYRAHSVPWWWLRHLSASHCPVKPHVSSVFRVSDTGLWSPDFCHLSIKPLCVFQDKYRCSFTYSWSHPSKHGTLLPVWASPHVHGLPGSHSSLPSPASWGRTTLQVTTPRKRAKCDTPGTVSTQHLSPMQHC